MSNTKQEFHVVIAHSMILSAVVKVDAVTEEEAMQLARKQFGKLQPGDFRLEGKDQLQQPFAISAVAVDELETKPGDVRDRVMEEVCFMTMWADITEGTGYLHAQPWLAEKSSTMRLDLAQDWIEQLSGIADAASEELYGVGIHELKA